METDKQRYKNHEEVNLIADFEMEYGNEENWSDEIKTEFDQKWEEIQKAFA